MGGGGGVRGGSGVDLLDFLRTRAAAPASPRRLRRLELDVPVLIGIRAAEPQPGQSSWRRLARHRSGAPQRLTRHSLASQMMKLTRVAGPRLTPPSVEDANRAHNARPRTHTGHTQTCTSAAAIGSCWSQPDTAAHLLRLIFRAGG